MSVEIETYRLDCDYEGCRAYLVIGDDNTDEIQKAGWVVCDASVEGIVEREWIEEGDKCYCPIHSKGKVWIGSQNGNTVNAARRLFMQMTFTAPPRKHGVLSKE